MWKWICGFALVLLGCSSSPEKQFIAPEKAQSKAEFLHGTKPLATAPLVIEMDLARGKSRSFRIHGEQRALFLQAVPLTQPWLLTRLKGQLQKKFSKQPKQIKSVLSKVNKNIEKKGLRTCARIVLQSNSETALDFSKWTFHFLQSDKNLRKIELKFISAEEAKKKFGTDLADTLPLRNLENYPKLISGIACGRTSIDYSKAFALFAEARFRKNVTPMRLEWSRPK